MPPVGPRLSPIRQSGPSPFPEVFRLPRLQGFRLCPDLPKKIAKDEKPVMTEGAEWKGFFERTMPTIQTVEIAMEITTRKAEGGTIVSLNGRMDALTAPEFEAQMSHIIDAGDRRLVIDMHGLGYISSAGVRSILVVAKKLQAEGGKLALARLTDMVREVLELTGFIKILTICDSTEAALERL